MSESSDRKDKIDLDQVIKDSVDRAEQVFPRGRLTLRLKVLLFIGATLLLLNSSASVVESAVLVKQGNCQNQRSYAITATRNADQQTSDRYVHDSSALFLKVLGRKISIEQADANLAVILKNYDTDRAATERTRAELAKKTCN